MTHAAGLTSGGGVQAAILAETGAPAPEGCTREQLLRMLHAARDPRSRGRHAGREAGKVRPQNITASPSSSEWDKYENYYRMQLQLPPQELDTFFETMRSPLPVTFRLAAPCAGRCSCLVLRALDATHTHACMHMCACTHVRTCVPDASNRCVLCT